MEIYVNQDLMLVIKRSRSRPGSKVLSAKLSLLKASQPTPTKRYFDIQQQLKSLNEIKISSATGKAFNFIDMPDEPVTKDKPKKTLILALGLILGVMISCISILFLSFLKKKCIVR